MGAIMTGVVGSGTQVGASLANRLQFLSCLLRQFWLQVSKTRREEKENIGRTGRGKI